MQPLTQLSEVNGLIALASELLARNLDDSVLDELFFIETPEGRIAKDKLRIHNQGMIVDRVLDTSISKVEQLINETFEE